MSWAAISQIEAGRRKDIRLSSLSALAAALEITLDQLATGEPATPPPFTHSALLYRGKDAFLAMAVPYLRAGVTRRERPLAVTTAPNIRDLKAGLGTDAAAVQFEDSSEWYRSPVVALEGYRSYVDDNLAAGARAVRILGEPTWKGRSPAAIKAWTRYESLLNIVFAGSSVVLTCPYDMRSGPLVISGARRTHPQLTGPDARVANEGYNAPEELLLET